MKAKFIAQEDADLEVDRAAAAQAAADSTATPDLASVANYREELDKLRQDSNNDSSTDGTDSTTDNGGDDDTGSAEQGTGETNDNGGSDGASSGDADQQDDSGDSAGQADTSDDEKTEVTEEAIEPTEEAMSVAQETIDYQCTLAHMNSIVRDSLEQGGISTSASALAVEGIVNAIKNRLGIPSGQSAMSLESFDSLSTRVVSTEGFMDTVSETVKRVWEAIKKFFKGIYVWVAEFITGAKRAEQVRVAETRATEDARKKLEGTEIEEALAKNIASKVYRSRSVHLVDTDADIDFKQMYTISMDYQKLVDAYTGAITRVTARFQAIFRRFASNTIDVRLFDQLQLVASDFRGVDLKEGRVTVAQNLREENLVLTSEATVGNRRLFVTCSNEKYQANDASKQHQVAFMKAESSDSARGGVFFTPHVADLKILTDFISRVMVVQERHIVNLFNREIADTNKIINTVIERGPAIWTTVVDADGNTFAINPETANVVCGELSNALHLYVRTVVNGTSSVLDGYSKHISAMNDYVNTNIRMIENSTNAKKSGKPKV